MSSTSHKPTSPAKVKPSTSTSPTPNRLKAMEPLSPELSDAPWLSLLHFHLLLAEQVLFKFGLSRSLDL